MSGLPTHIKEIVKNLSLDITDKAVIEFHSHLPFYQPFITENKYISIQNSMLYHGATKSRLGLLRNHVGANEVLRYCEVCMKEEIQNYGFPYWHRECAFPWVYFCPFHNLPLNEVDFNRLNYRERVLVLPGVGDLTEHRLSDEVSEKLIRLSKQTVEIIESKHQSIFTDATYHNLLTGMELATSGGHIKQSSITKIVREWLSPLRYLRPFDRLFETLIVERCWASAIAGDEKGFHHPIKHLILLNALNLEFADLLLAGFVGVQLELPLKKEGKKPSDSEILSAIASERSLSSAAKKLGVCVTTLCVEADRLGIEYTRRSKTITSHLRGEVLRLSGEGRNSTELASYLNISVTSVNRIKRSST
jgi:hypothetical protein